MKKILILIGIIAVVVLAIYFWPKKPVEKVLVPKAIPSQPIIQYDCGECKG